MVSFTSLFTFVLVAAAASSHAATTGPPACKEIHPKSGTSRTYVKPTFHEGKESKLIRKDFTASDGTEVLVRHQYQNSGSNLVLIKTKEPKVDRIELTFQDGKRQFQVQSDYTCYVPTKTNAVTLESVHYYKRS